MIRSVAFCPAAPVLIPDIAQGAAPELDELRAACRKAIVAADAPGRPWTVLAPGLPVRAFRNGHRGTFAGFGVPLEVGLGTGPQLAVTMPPSLTIGAWLLQDAGTQNAAVATTVDDASVASVFDAPVDDVSVLVVGDGSARRGVRAPGYLDERAIAFDARIGRALATGDAAALAALDPGLGHELLAAGVPAWRAVAAAVTGQQWDARLLHTGAPYGVAYFAAVWTARA